MFGLFLLISCGNKTNENDTNLHPLIIESVDEILFRYKNSSYYDCIRKEILNKLQKEITAEEIKAIEFQGRSNVKHQTLLLDFQTKIANAISDTLGNSSCIETWK